MKKLLLVLLLTITALVTNAQTKILDFYGQTHSYCKLNLLSYKEVETDTYYLISGNVQGTNVVYAVNKVSRLVELVFLPYKSNDQMKSISSSLNEISKPCAKNTWCLTTEKLNLPVTCTLLKKEKMFIFQ